MERASEGGIDTKQSESEDRGNKINVNVFVTSRFSCQTPTFFPQTPPMHKCKMHFMRCGVMLFASGKETGTECRVKIVDLPQERSNMGWLLK